MQIFLQENAKYCTFLRPNRKKIHLLQKNDGYLLQISKIFRTFAAQLKIDFHTLVEIRV